MQLKPRGAFSNAAMDADVEAIREAYKRVGRDDATVTTQVMDLGQDRVNVVYNINEGGRTKIAAINFVGNSAYCGRRLSEVISTKRSSVFPVCCATTSMTRTSCGRRGSCCGASITTTAMPISRSSPSSADLDPSTNAYTLTVTVEEGQRYTFGDINVESTISGVDPNSLRSLVRPATATSTAPRRSRTRIIALTEHVAGLGYAFAQVTPRGDRNFENHTIPVIYTIDQGPRTYVERIEIRGNANVRATMSSAASSTSAKVTPSIRFSSSAPSGGLKSSILRQWSRVSTAPGSQPDRSCLVVDVAEKSTGELSMGAGYTTGGETAGPQVEGSLTERNFLGRGQYIRFGAGGGKNSRDYVLSFTEPYFLGRRIAAGFDIFKSTRTYDELRQQHHRRLDSLRPADHRDDFDVACL